MHLRTLGGFVLATAMTFGLPLSSAVAQTAGQDVHAAGHDTKDAAVDTGHATKKVAKKTGHVTAKGYHKTVHGTKTVGKDIGHGTKVGTEKTIHGTENLGDKIAGKPEKH